MYLQRFTGKVRSLEGVCKSFKLLTAKTRPYSRISETKEDLKDYRRYLRLRKEQHESMEDRNKEMISNKTKQLRNLIIEKSEAKVKEIEDSLKNKRSVFYEEKINAISKDIAKLDFVASISPEDDIEFIENDFIRNSIQDIVGECVVPEIWDKNLYINDTGPPEVDMKINQTIYEGKEYKLCKKFLKHIDHVVELNNATVGLRSGHSVFVESSNRSKAIALETKLDDLRTTLRSMGRFFLENNEMVVFLSQAEGGCKLVYLDVHNATLTDGPTEENLIVNAIAVDKQNEIYSCTAETPAKILKITGEDSVILYEDVSQKLVAPKYMTVGENGDVVLSDPGSGKIYIFKDLVHKGRLAEIIEFDVASPAGICAYNGTILLCDTERHTVSYLDESGESSVWQPLIGETDGLEKPMDVKIIKDNILVIGQENGQVKHFAVDDPVLTSSNIPQGATASASRSL